MRNAITISTCSCCGKPLSDPISVALGMGAICRVNQKQISANEKTTNMFATRAEYDTDIIFGVLCITDCGGAKSVTNDLDNILRELTVGTHAKIIYRDSEGIWDGVIWNGTSVQFYSINEKNMRFAAMKALKHAKL